MKKPVRRSLPLISTFFAFHRNLSFISTMLSLEDSTSIALKIKDISEDKLKRIYRDDRYTNYQAARAKRFIEDNKVIDTAVTQIITDSIHLNDPLRQLYCPVILLERSGLMLSLHMKHYCQSLVPNCRSSLT